MGGLPGGGRVRYTAPRRRPAPAADLGKANQQGTDGVMFTCSPFIEGLFHSRP
jgi:hypothetical protein